MSVGKVRISLVIQDLYRQGAQYVTAMVARGFVQRGYEVDLVVGRVHRDMAEEHPELKPFSVPESVRWIHLAGRKASRNVLELAKYFRRERPQAVFTMCSTYDRAVGLALWLCGRDRPRFLPVEHGAFLERPIRTSLFRRSLCWLWWSRVDLQLAVSEGVRDALVNVRKRFPAEKVFLVDNPVIDETYWHKLAQPPAHCWLKEKSGVVFVAAGAHVKLKGYDTLIRAFARLGNTDAKLIIFGNGPETSNYKKLINDLGLGRRVSLPGFTSNLPAEIKAADAFVVASETESFSIVLVEALAAGTPVVSTDCPLGPPTILQHGKFGIMCPVGDVDALSSALSKIINGEGIPPMSRSWSRYTLEKVMDNYEAALRIVGTKKVSLS